MDYSEFLAAKTIYSSDKGLTARVTDDRLFNFQRHLVDWALAKGSAAIFADCGLGKTPMQLEWANQVVEQTGGRVLILTPLAVTGQTLREADKFDIEAQSVKDKPHPGINVINYERIHHLDRADFVGVVCDESSILKNFDGTRRQQITDFMRAVPYRLLCTATAAPNDYIELGTSSEALGYLGHMDMLGRFFRNDMNNASTGRQWGTVSKWRFKGHAQEPFWKWVASWARACRTPSDLGFKDARFTLPPLTETEHVVKVSTPRPGYLFDLPAAGWQEEREETRRSITERCEMAAQLVDHDDPALVWCHLNDEGDALEKLIPGAVQVSGKDSDDEKARKLLGFADGEFRVLITKPKIGGFGLNYQHCAHVTFFPSHSFEQYYQSVRRCWRFGQTRPVKVDIVTTEGGTGVLKNLQRKQKQASDMFDALIRHMTEAMNIGRDAYGTRQEEIPSWL